MSDKAEVWLRGPLDDIPGLLQPVAHTLLQAQEELNELMVNFPEELLWEKPFGLASTGFHLQHLAGVINRLFTYARGEQLDPQQLTDLAAEGRAFEKDMDVRRLCGIFESEVEKALAQLRKIDVLSLTDKREVGRSKLPSTVIGLYVHAAEHTMRHIGQLLVTVKIAMSNNITDKSSKRHQY